MTTNANSLMSGSSGPRFGQAIERGQSIAEEELGVFGGRTWKIGDAFQGTQIFGGTGSGKTTGSGAAIALAFLRAGFGGLVLTAKADDGPRWRRYAQLCGREGDIVEIIPGSDASFNILDHEYRRGGRLTHNVVSLLMGAMTSGTDSTSSEPYWNEALRELLIHAIDLSVLSGAGVESRNGGPPSPRSDILSLLMIDRIIRSAPQSRDDVRDPDWRRDSACWRLLRQADAACQAGALSPALRRDLEATIDYWVQDFPNLSARTRSIIVSTFTAKVAGLLRSPLRELFFENTDPAFSPESSMRAARDGRFGKIIIVNLPVKTYGEVGRLAQILYKIAWTRTADRRSGLFGATGQSSPNNATPTDDTLQSPAFLWADESQYFITPEDQLFQQTARSSRVATVYLTQNVGNYKSVLGRGNEAAVYSLLGNLQTKVFHTNGDPATNRFAEETFGKEWSSLQSKSVSAGDSSQNGHVSHSTSRNTNSSLHFVDVATAKDMTMLMSGGRRYQYKIGAIVFQAGRNWSKPGDKESPPTNAFWHIFDQHLD